VPVPNELFELLPKPAQECRLVIIPNAKDYKLPDERAVSLDELTADLEKLGFMVDITDLRDYDDTESLHERLKSFDVMYVAGGNSFMLRAEMQRSGLDQFLGDLVNNDVVYCGESAGAIVAGTTLEGAEISDEPELADMYIADGLSLVNKVVAPHADSIEFVEYINSMKKRYPDNAQVIYINDNQALVVNDSDQKIVTAS